VRFLRRPIDDLWLVAAVALAALAAMATPIPTVDVAYLVRTGDIILSTGALPVTDPFTFSAAGQEWVVQQWGTAVAVALAFEAAGWVGLFVLEALIVAVVFGILLLTIRRAGARPRTAAFLTLGALLVALSGLALRAQLFGVLFFAITLALAGERRRNPRILLLVPFVIVAWANMHGTFPIGIAVVGWALLEDLAGSRRAGRLLPPSRAVRFDVVVIVLSIAATLVNPFGPRVWAYAAGLASSSTVIKLVSEWQAPVPATVIGATFFGSALLVALLVGARWRRTTWPTRLWLLGLAAFAAWAIRGVVWWGLGSVVAIAPLFSAAAAGARGPLMLGGTDGAPAPVAGDTDPPAAVDAGGPDGAQPSAPSRRGAQPRAIYGVLAIAFAALPFVMLAVIVRGPTDPLAGPDHVLLTAPAGLARELGTIARPGARVFAQQTWGSWFEWAVPDALQFTDSRFEVVPEAAWKDYVAISNGRFDWAQSLDRIGAEILVVSRKEQEELLWALEATPSSGWREVYADDDGVIFTR
jgi:hypothetical protein